MPQPTGDGVAQLAAHRAELRDRYLRDPDGIRIELLSDDLMYVGGEWLDGR